MNKTIKGYFLVILASVFSVSMALISDFAMRTFPEIAPSNFSFYGAVGASFIMSFWFFRSKKSISKLKKCVQVDGKILVLCSIITSIGAVLWWTVLQKVGAGAIGIFSRSEILFTFILGVLFLRERFSWREIFTVLIIILGFVYFSKSDEKFVLSAVILILISRFLYALQSFLIKKFSPKIDGGAFAFLRTILMAFFLGFFFAIRGEISKIPFFAFFLTTLGIILNAGFSKMFFFEAHKYLEISKLNLILILSPILSLIGAFVFLGDKISLQQAIGATIILLGLALFSREQFKNIRRSQET